MRFRDMLPFAVAAAVLAPSRPARSDENRCQRWNLEVTCVSPARVVLSQEFTASVTAKNTGDTALENVTVRLRGDQGAPCVSGPSAGVMVLVDRLEPGASKELSARFASETIGLARILGSAKDSLGWASGSCACSIEVAGLAAIGSDLTDKALDGSDSGVFKKGEEFLYVLFVSNDGGTGPTPDLKVVLTLPKELEFVSGTGERSITVKGSGQRAETSVFALQPPNEKVRIDFRVKVLSVPPTQLVKAEASIQSTTGVQLALERESTTVK